MPNRSATPRQNCAGARQSFRTSRHHLRGRWLSGRESSRQNQKVTVHVALEETFDVFDHSVFMYIAIPLDQEAGYRFIEVKPLTFLPHRRRRLNRLLAIHQPGVAVLGNERIDRPDRSSSQAPCLPRAAPRRPVHANPSHGTAYSRRCSQMVAHIQFVSSLGAKESDDGIRGSYRLFFHQPMS